MCPLLDSLSNSGEIVVFRLCRGGQMGGQAERSFRSFRYFSSFLYRLWGLVRIARTILRNPLAFSNLDVIKGPMKITLSTLLLLLLTISFAAAQSLETFETETVGSASFTSNAQVFNVSSTTSETYDVFEFGGGGWDGSAPDNRFIDNSSGTNGSNNGSSFIITTAGSVEFFVIDLYVFCSTTSLGNHTGTLTITGKNGGATVYTITKTTGFSNVSTLMPNNGFTYFDFATAGASDFTDDAIDELVFTSTGNLDYMALDAFQWEFAPLPIELNRLSISNQNDAAVLLDWETETETNNDKFIIERSTDAENYSPIGEIAGSGTTNQPHSYQYIDSHPVKGALHYRLKQIDFDGSSTYSEVRSVVWDSDNSYLVVFPNPVSNNLTIDFSSSMEGFVLGVRDSQGRLVYEQSLFDAGFHQLKLDVSTWSKGLYLFEVSNGKQRHLKKVIVR